MSSRIIYTLLGVTTIICFTLLFQLSPLAAASASAPLLNDTQVTLSGIQVNRSGLSSRYAVTNLGAAQAALVHTFYAETPPDMQVASIVDSGLAASATRITAVDEIAQLPDGFRGYVIISSNQLITATMVPTADFFPTKHEGNPPFAVHFTNTSAGEYTASQWDFGDGQTSIEANPTHTYAITGTYSVKLTVTGPSGTDTLIKPDLIKVHSFPPIHPDGWDLNFGNYGKVSTGCSGYGTVHQLSNGSLLVSTICGISTMAQRYLLRYLPDGSIDPAFGSWGRVAIDSNQVSVVAVQSDDKMIVNNGFQLARFNIDGTPDSSFGTNGLTTIPPQVDGTQAYHIILVQPDDKIIAIGGGFPIVIARYTANGEFDTTFNGQGVLLINEAYGHAYTLLNNGKILMSIEQEVIVNEFTGERERQPFLLQYNTDGTPDVSFGTNGKVQGLSFGAFAEQSNGKIIALEGYRTLRLLPNGQPDSSFTPISGGEAVMLTVDGSDRILVDHRIDGYAGSIRRYLPDGAIDPDFPSDGLFFKRGWTLIPIVQPDGNILVAHGLISPGGGYYDEATLLRYIDDHPVLSPTTKPLALLYAVLDNNLGDSWTRLVNNVEAGVRSGMHVRLLIDGPTDNDVYVYNVMQDNNPFCPSPANPTCDGRYAEGVNFWRLTNENSAHPDSLYQFLVDAVNAYPTADKISLSLIGHGSGWSANVLPGQPSIWRDQNETVGGMLWDDHPGAGQSESRSLSTKALGQALQWANAQSGKRIDLLYLDGCSMGMAEVAYEVRDGAHFLLASPNIDWASFNYDELLPAVATDSGQALGQRWLQLEAARFRANPGHPFTLSLLDLSQMVNVATAATGFADALSAALPTQRNALLNAFAAAGRFDSDYNGTLDQADAYTDLPDFVTQVQVVLPNENALVNAGQALKDALTLAVVAKDDEGGAPWLFSDEDWQWANYGGLGVYLPLGQDETRRQLFYNQANLAWTADTTWDEFLVAFWADGVGAAHELAEMPVCHATIDGCQGLANPLPVQAPSVFYSYLPLLMK